MSQISEVTDLMSTMNFTIEDLAANRSGRLSIHQQARLKKMRARNAVIGLSLFLIFVILATTLLYIGQINHSLVLTLIGIMITICNAILAGFFARNWIRISADLRNGKIEIIDGIISRIIRPSGPTNNYILRINGINIHVKKEVFRLFRHQTAYKLYRARHSRVLLSAEPEITIHNSSAV